MLFSMVRSALLHTADFIIHSFQALKNHLNIRNQWFQHMELSLKTIHYKAGMLHSSMWFPDQMYMRNTDQWNY